jgi:monoamine oxidase
VLAIPFTTLRNVDLSQAGLSPLKMTAIQNLPLGTAAKTMMQFSSRIWYPQGYTANLYYSNDANTASGVVWENTNYQAGDTGILVDLAGGTPGLQFASTFKLTADAGVAPASLVNANLAALEPIFPGLTRAYNGRAYYHAPLIDPHLLGAWSLYNIGQYTGFSGIEPVQEGNIHFAGEHTSQDYQGYMEGGVQSGERAATEIVQDLPAGCCTLPRTRPPFHYRPTVQRSVVEHPALRTPGPSSGCPAAGVTGDRAPDNVHGVAPSPRRPEESVIDRP